MSTLTARETVTRLATLPRVNLLPPEIEQQRQFKKVQAGLGLGVVAAVGVVGALVLAAGAQVSDAQNELDTADRAQHDAAGGRGQVRRRPARSTPRWTPPRRS